ncbi:MAG: translocation/assembly module TamB domain-containing protein [Acidobacteria bacterium]|nr:translocation/assembly module TamB domain-containing protein [Acidobacteriota bacterium]
MSKRFQKLLYVLGALVILAGAALGILSTSWFQGALERRVVARLESATGGRVEVGQFHFNPAIFQFTLRGLVLHGRRLPSEPPLFKAQAVVVRISPRSLLRRKLILTSFEWDGAEVHLMTRPDGTTNLPAPTSPAAPGGIAQDLVDWSIGRVTLARTQVFWNDQRVPVELGAEEVGLLLRFHPVERYSGTISVTSANVKTPQRIVPLTYLAARFKLTETDAEVTSLVWEFAGLKGKGSFDLHNPSSPRGSFAFQIDGGISELSRTLGLDHLHGGRVTGNGKGTYGPDAFEVKGTFQAMQLGFRMAEFQPGPIDLATDYSVARNHAQLSNLVLTALGGTARGSGEIALEDPAPQVRLMAQVDGLDLTTLLRSFTRADPTLTRIPFASKLHGTAEINWRGWLEDLKSRFDLRFQAPGDSAPGLYPVQGSMRGSLETTPVPMLRILASEFRTPGSRLTAQGILGQHQAALAVELDTANFEEWRPLAKFFARATEPIPLVLRSVSTISGTVRGPIRRPEIRARVSMGSFEFRDWTWDSLRADITAGPTFLEVSSGRLLGGDSALTVAGSVTLGDWRVAHDGPARLTVQMQGTPVEGLRAVLGMDHDFRGLATGRLDLEGTLSNLTGTGALRVDRGVYAGETIDSVSARLRIEESVWHVDDVDVAKGAGNVTGQVRVEPDRRFFSTDLKGAGLALSDFKFLESAGKPGAPGQLQGDAGFELHGEGTLEDVHLTATWNIASLRVSDSDIGDFHGRLDWQGQRMDLEGSAAGPGGDLTFGGKVRTEGDWGLDLAGEFSNLRTGPWIRLATGEKFKARVIVAGSFIVHGPLKNPKALVMRSQVRNLEINFPDLSWKNESPVELRYENRGLTVSRFRLRGPSTNLEIEGSIRFGEPAALSLVAQGSADATLLSLIDPALQASGSSQLKARVTGTPNQPRVYGVITVQDVSLGYSDLPFRLTGLSGEIALEGERATLRSLKGASGGGSVVLSGFATLGGAQRFDARMDLRNVRVQYPRDFTSVLGGSLRFVGTADRGQITGELTVQQLFASERFNLLAHLGESEGPGSGETPGIPSRYASNMRLNVQVSSSPAVRLETRDLRLVADIDLRILGTLANPVEVGTIHILSGEALFRGNRYKINRGDISMTNPFRTQRTIDLEAQTRVQRYDLTVDLSGPLHRLKVAYRSDPPLPTSDVLSLLALGFASQQAEMSTTTSQALPTVGASALLSEALSSQVSGRIQQLFGVSRIKIDPNVGGLGATTGGARVTVEQQVTRDFTITYVTTTDSSQRRIIQVEWVLNDKVSLFGVRDQNGIIGGELRFRQRFK